jgi:hypothetical protein
MVKPFMSFNNILQCLHLVMFRLPTVEQATQKCPKTGYINLIIHIVKLQNYTKLRNQPINQLQVAAWFKARMILDSSWVRISLEARTYARVFLYEGVTKSFRTDSITKSTTTNTTSWEATQMVMAAKLTRLTHNIAIQLNLVAESVPFAVLAPGGKSGNF